jgi:hypothetical protein
MGFSARIIIHPLLEDVQGTFHLQFTLINIKAHARDALRSRCPSGKDAYLHGHEAMMMGCTYV